MPTPSACRNSHSSTTCGSRRGVADLAVALGGGRGEQRGLGAGDRRLVEIDRRAASGRRARRSTWPGASDRLARPSRAAPRGAWRSCAAPGNRRRAAPAAPSRAAPAADRAAAPSRAAGRPAPDRARRLRRARTANPQRRRAASFDRRAETDQQVAASRRRRGCAARSSARTAARVSRHAAISGSAASCCLRRSIAPRQRAAALDQQCRPSETPDRRFRPAARRRTAPAPRFGTARSAGGCLRPSPGRR